MKNLDPMTQTRENGALTKTVTSSKHSIQGMVYNVPNPASYAEHMPAWTRLGFNASASN
jgi:hypothetical protein